MLCLWCCTYSSRPLALAPFPRGDRVLVCPESSPTGPGVSLANVQVRLHDDSSFDPDHSPFHQFPGKVPFVLQPDFSNHLPLARSSKDSNGHYAVLHQGCRRAFGFLPIGLIQFRSIHGCDVHGEARLVSEDPESVSVFKTDYDACKSHRIRHTLLRVAQCQGHENDHPKNGGSLPRLDRFLHVLLPAGRTFYDSSLPAEVRLVKEIRWSGDKEDHLGEHRG